jgi:hypothetical protein
MTFAILPSQSINLNENETLKIYAKNRNF